MTCRAKLCQVDRIIRNKKVNSLSNLKNEGYILGKEYYLPERVFFCNLYGYCRCNTDDFLDEAYSMMGNHIEESLSVVLNHLETAEKHYEKNTSKSAHFLPPFFKKFVEKEIKFQSSQKEKEHPRASNYLLSRCYYKVCAVVDYIERSDVNKTYNARDLAEDRETIDRFREISVGANPLSARDFNRIQQATGVPLTKRTSETKSYSDNQDIVVRFAIEKVIPAMILRPQRPMLSFLASRDWHDVVCNKNVANGIAACVILVDPVDDRGFSEYIKACFEELKTIANLPKEKQDVSQIGSVLLKMYNRIYVEHKNGTLWGIRTDDPPLRDVQKTVSQENDKLPLADDKKYEHDWLISTHILNWLDSHNFMHQDIPEFRLSALVSKPQNIVIGQQRPTSGRRCRHGKFCG